jgi:hypothetical protein
MVEANLQKVVGPTQLHLDLGVSKQMIVWLVAMKNYFYSSFLFLAPSFKFFKAICLMLKLSQLVSSEVRQLLGLCRVEKWRFPDFSTKVIWPTD